METERQKNTEKRMSTTEVLRTQLNTVHKNYTSCKSRITSCGRAQNPEESEELRGEVTDL